MKKSNFSEKAIAYIDGFNLYYGLRKLKLPELKWLNLQAFVEEFLPQNTELIKINYFTTRISGPNEQRYRQSQYIDVNKKCSSLIEVIEGHYLSKTVKCASCNKEFSVPEEKMTDVNIASQMLIDAYQKKYDIAILVSGDSDLVMPVQHIVSMGNKVKVVFPPHRSSVKLKEYATNSQKAKRKQLLKSLLPPQVKTKRNIIQIPEEWNTSESVNWDENKKIWIINE